MKKSAYALLTLILIMLAYMVIVSITGCEEPKQKPFIIIYKSDCWNCEMTYEFVDANGITNRFIDSCQKYNIGDTLK